MPAIARTSPTSTSSSTTRWASRSVSPTTRPRTRRRRTSRGVTRTSPAAAAHEILGGDKNGVQSSFYERMGFLGVVEYRPTDTVHMVLDAYHSDFKELQTIQRVEYGTIWANPSTPVTNPVKSSNDRIQSGTFNNVPFVVIENYNNDRDAKIKSIGLNTDFDVNDHWGLNADLSYSNVKRDDLRLESTAGNGTFDDPLSPAAADTISFTTRPDGRTDLTRRSIQRLRRSCGSPIRALGRWSRRSGFVGHPEIEDEIQAIRLSARRTFEGFLGDVSFGVNYAERDQGEGPIPEPSVFTRERLACDRARGVPHGHRRRLVLRPPRTVSSATTRIGLWNSGFWQPINAVDDPNASTRSHLRRDERLEGEREADHRVREARNRHTIGELPLRGNIGVQSVTADQTSRIGYVEADIRTRRSSMSIPNRGRQVHRHPAEPEPGARAAARPEAALRRGHHRGPSAHGRAGRWRRLQRDPRQRYADAWSERRAVLLDAQRWRQPRAAAVGSEHLRPVVEKYFARTRGTSRSRSTTRT